MNQRANPKLIGAFVVGAVALVVVGVLLLGGAKWLTQKRTFVAYFEGSVKGLNVGAPVEFQGVQVGSVTDIQLQFLTAEEEFRIPVFIQIEPGQHDPGGSADRGAWTAPQTADRTRSPRAIGDAEPRHGAAHRAAGHAILTPRFAWWVTARSRKFRRRPPRCKRWLRPSRKR